MSTEQVSLVTYKYLLSYISTNFSLLIKLLRIMIPLLLALLLQYFGLDPDRQRNPHIHIYLVGRTMKFLPNCVSRRLTSLSSILKERKKSWCSKQYHKLAFDQIGLPKWYIWPDGGLGGSQSDMMWMKISAVFHASLMPLFKNYRLFKSLHVYPRVQ